MVMSMMQIVEQIIYSYYTNQKAAQNAILIVVIPLILILLKQYFNGGVNQEKPNMKNKVVLITGANTGIGKESAKTIAKLGGTVICACRDQAKGQQAVAEIIKETNNKNVEFQQLDLSSLQSVREFCQKFLNVYSRLDVLINNAGIMALPSKKLSKDGLELQMATNHFGHFLLTNLLSPVLVNSAPSRVINVSSLAHNHNSFSLDNLNAEKGYRDFLIYGNSKIANILFAKEFAKRFKDKNVKSVALHPGAIRTELARNLAPHFKIGMLIFSPIYWFLSKNIEQGAQTQLYCALVDHDKLVNGAYYSDCKVKKPLKKAEDEKLAKDFWEKSLQIVGLK